MLRAHFLLTPDIPSWHIVSITTGDRHMNSSIEVGDRVQCGAGSIDRSVGAGAAGRVAGFARLSAHHPREAYVTLDSGESFWFWERDVARIEAA